MVAVLVDDTFGLVHQILVNFLTTAQLHAMIRPRRSFELQIDAHTVGSSEGGFGWTVRMETDVVDAVLLAFAEDAQPYVFIGGWIASFREAAIFDGAAQVERPIVDKHLRTVDAEVAQAKRHADGHTLIVNCTRIKLRMELVPGDGVITQWKVVGGVVDDDVDGAVLQIWDDATTPNVRAGL